MKEISEMKDLFYRAYSLVSFSPNERAESCVKDFSQELSDDLAKLGENQGDYKERYIEHLRTWATRKSRCMSPMITGPANFPVNKNRKANESEQNAWKEFRSWRSKYIKLAFAESKKAAPLSIVKKSTIHLQGIGEHFAIPAKDLKAGMTRVYNYGSTSKVISVEIKGKSVYETVEDNGKLYTSRRGMNTLLAVSKKGVKQ